MYQLLSDVLPQSLAILLSPELLILSLWIASLKQDALKKVWLMCLGSTLALFVFVMIGTFIGTYTVADKSWSRFYFRLALGFVMLILAVTSFFRKHKGFKKDKLENIKLFTSFAIGVAAIVVNIKITPLAISAGNVISNASNVVYEKVLSYIIFITLGMIPLLIPAIIKTVNPNIIDSMIRPCEIFLEKYSKYVVIIICLVFAVMFFKQAINAKPI